jgi:predicted peptidase
MKLLKSNLPVLLLMLVCCASVNRTDAQASVFSYQKYIEKGDTLNYRELFPDFDTLRKYPLVIFLHGSGERGNDNEAQLKWGVKDFAQMK